MTDHALRLLRQNPRLAELAAFPFNFDLARAAHGHVEEVRLASGGPLETVAGDDTGGTYFVCADGSMLYADSEGSAGIIGSSVDEALQIVIGLADWGTFVDLDLEDGEEKILAWVAEVEEGVRESCDLDEARAELRAGLGFADRSPVDLLRLLQAALLRTEPEFVLLNAEEHSAYDLLDAYPRRPLWEPVLASGRADLALLRAGDREVWDAVAEDPVRRRLTLRAAQFDRAEGDLELLRHLLRHETRSSMSDELRLAAVLVGLRGDIGDLPLLHEVRETTYDTWCGLGGMPDPGASGDELREWAKELDESLFGTDPADEPVGTWTDLARQQGMTELARIALIRRLDEIVMDQSRLRRPDAPRELTTAPLRALAHDFEQLGDRFQALRAQRLFAALREGAGGRVLARLDQARLERAIGQLPQALRTLASVRETLATSEDDSVRNWRCASLGRFTAKEHYRLTRALADADLPEEARALLAAADAILGELSENAANSVRELADETSARVGEVS
ncbi:MULTISPECIES: hypothetical protein [unclassified Streptomyces]|uniref:hypothetical protein n=1 Tax=unclassified Streptomyces TaxID=2593676 RepID=UPI002365AD19|nr:MULTISPECIES: hypothetical protein [unclassified Streptomyces]MDF3144958.1 hypothetical protein [Streptomyces sp. T21Q-yed]WDF42180.1 hypothetical protein PBV52_37975 [Streptomyces sp. T12]